LWISTGSADPPETAIRMFLRSSPTSIAPPASSRAFSRPQYIVGTPAKWVTFSLSISASAAPGSKRGSITSVPP
jgi:hypothetical protein